MARNPLTGSGESDDSVESAHRMVATAMLVTAAVVAISQHWFLVLRQWIFARVSSASQGQLAGGQVNVR